MEKKNAVYTIMEEQSPEEARREHILLIARNFAAGAATLAISGTATGIAVGRTVERGLIGAAASYVVGLIVLVIIMLVFGTKKLRNMGSDLGGAVKGFKDGMKEGDASVDASQQTISGRQTIDGEAREKVDKTVS